MEGPLKTSILAEELPSIKNSKINQIKSNQISLQRQTAMLMGKINNLHW